MWFEDIPNKYFVPLAILGDYFNGEKICLHLNDARTREAIKNKDVRLLEALEEMFSFADIYRIPAWGTDQVAWDHFAGYFDTDTDYEKFLQDIINNPFATQMTLEGRSMTVKEMAIQELGYLYEQRAKKTPQNNKPAKRKGYIYILQAQMHGRPCKIGYSKTPNKRTEWIGLKVPFDTEVLNVFPVDDMVSAESQLHELFSAKRQEGEWFDLTDKDIEYLKLLSGYQDGKFIKEGACDE